MSDGFKARVLVCCECGEEFVFTVEAQQYFAERGYTEDPRRCKTCYTKFKKLQREQQQGSYAAADVKTSDRFD
jgi:hypothetical protein